MNSRVSWSVAPETAYQQFQLAPIVVEEILVHLELVGCVQGLWTLLRARRWYKWRNRVQSTTEHTAASCDECPGRDYGEYGQKSFMGPPDCHQDLCVMPIQSLSPVVCSVP